MRFLRQGTDADIIVGPVIDALDFLTPKTAIAWNTAGIDVDVYKVGAKSNVVLALAAGNGYWRHIANGYYAITLGSTAGVFLTDTVGRLRVTLNVPGALPVWGDFTVLPAVAYDSLIAGTDNFDVNAVQWLGEAAGAMPAKVGDLPAAAPSAESIASAVWFAARGIAGSETENTMGAAFMQTLYYIMQATDALIGIPGDYQHATKFITDLLAAANASVDANTVGGQIKNSATSAASAASSAGTAANTLTVGANTNASIKAAITTLSTKVGTPVGASVVADIAALVTAILLNPANKIATDASGHVTATNGGTTVDLQPVLDAIAKLEAAVLDETPVGYTRVTHQQGGELRAGSIVTPYASSDVAHLSPINNPITVDVNGEWAIDLPTGDTYTLVAKLPLFGTVTTEVTT